MVVPVTPNVPPTVALSCTWRLLFKSNKPAIVVVPVTPNVPPTVALSCTSKLLFKSKAPATVRLSDNVATPEIFKLLIFAVSLTVILS